MDTDDPPSSALDSAQSVHYEIHTEEMIGRSDHSDVYRATDHANPHIEYVAKKYVLSNFKDFEKCYRESGAKEKIPPHRNVLMHSRIRLSHGVAEIIMERWGSSLAAYLQKMNPSLEQRVDIMGQIAEGIKHIHQHNFAHRNLKPSNVLIKVQADGSVVCRVSDMELCRDTNRGEMAAGTGGVGDVEWRAPEIQEDPGEYSNSVDVFSLGLLFQLLLTHSPGKRIQATKGNIDISYKTFPNFCNVFLIQITHYEVPLSLL